MFRPRVGIVSLSIILACCGINVAAADWTPLAAGADLAYVTAKKPSAVGDSRIVVVRVDPALWRLTLLTPGDAEGGKGRTAKEWARDNGLAVVINAGMYALDCTTHVGYLEDRAHGKIANSNQYQSVAAFDPHDPKERLVFRIYDLDVPGDSMEMIRRKYGTLVQNLRLIKRPGTNQWSRQDRQWSEAALGEDLDGRILFIFCRSPFSMSDLNRELLSADIGIVAAQHLDGGPPAQLYVNLGGVELELCGSYETAVREDGDNTSAWRIPNVLGIRRYPVPENPVEAKR